MPETIIISGVGKPVARERIARFLSLLHERDMTFVALCKAAGVGRSHATQVIAGKRRGKFSWRKLAKVMTVEEQRVLRGEEERFHMEQTNVCKFSGRKVKLKRRATQSLVQVRSRTQSGNEEQEAHNV